MSKYVMTGQMITSRGEHSKITCLVDSPALGDVVDALRELIAGDPGPITADVNLMTSFQMGYGQPATYVFMDRTRNVGDVLVTIMITSVYGA